MRARDRDEPGADAALRRGIVGIGDGVRLDRFAELGVGTLVWTRTSDGAYRLGRISGPLSRDDAGEAGIVDVRPCRWLERAFAEDEVPVAVAATFARGGRNFQRTHDAEAERRTAALWAESTGVRIAGAADAPAAARLLHAFNREYDDVTPGPARLAARLRELLAAGDTAVLLASEGVAVLRFRPSLWTAGLEAYLAELYVAPERRGAGLGRALLESAIDLATDRGADYMDLGTSEDDAAARSLYESLGFINREGGPDGPVIYGYERELP